MEDKLLEIGYRKKIIEEIKGDENIQRKIVSYKKFNMQEDNFYQYVKEYLESKLDASTVKEMSIFASINLQRRISKAEASLYRKAPDRRITIAGKQSDELAAIYQEMDVNSVMRRANEAFKYQGQCALQVYPHKGVLKLRALLPHHYDVIPDESNPEDAMAYIISNFDNTHRDHIRRDNKRTGYSQGDKYRDGVNQEIADFDDQSLREERYYVWTKRYNFVMNGKGEILDKIENNPVEIVDLDDPNIVSPLAEFECLPFIDVSNPKSFEFWVRGYDSLFDACITYNVILTSEFQTVELQGHAQAYYKGDANHMPENIRIGPDKIIHIPIDPNSPTNSEFGFANPGSDLGGIREFRESYLTAFLTSRGLDSSIVNGRAQTSTASSGTEKLLQMVEKFEASQDDVSTFERAERDLFYIITCWIKSLYSESVDGQALLNDDFKVQIPDNDYGISINFTRPEMIKSESETLDIKQKELEMGLTSRVHILMEMKNMNMEQAKEYLAQVDELEGLNGSDKQTEIL